MPGDGEYHPEFGDHPGTGPPGSKWAEGRYTAYLYGYEHKLVEAAWNVEEG